MRRRKLSLMLRLHEFQNMVDSQSEMIKKRNHPLRYVRVKSAILKT